MKIETKFSIGQKVRITELQCDARILAVYITIDANSAQYNCRWFMNGEIKTGYVLESELEEYEIKFPQLAQTRPGYGVPNVKLCTEREMPMSLSAPELS